MTKKLIFQDETRRRLKSGLDQTARAITITLGPKGRNVGLNHGWGPPTITPDGVTVAREIELGNRSENMGAQLLRAAALKTGEMAG